MSEVGSILKKVDEARAREMVSLILCGQSYIMVVEVPQRKEI